MSHDLTTRWLVLSNEKSDTLGRVYTYYLHLRFPSRFYLDCGVGYVFITLVTHSHMIYIVITMCHIIGYSRVVINKSSLKTHRSVVNACVNGYVATQLCFEAETSLRQLVLLPLFLLNLNTTSVIFTWSQSCSNNLFSLSW